MWGCFQLWERGGTEDSKASAAEEWQAEVTELRVLLHLNCPPACGRTQTRRPYATEQVAETAASGSRLLWAGGILSLSELLTTGLPLRECPWSPPWSAASRGHTSLPRDPWKDSLPKCAFLGGPAVNSPGSMIMQIPGPLRRPARSESLGWGTLESTLRFPFENKPLVWEKPQQQCAPSNYPPDPVGRGGRRNSGIRMGAGAGWCLPCGTLGGAKGSVLSQHIYEPADDQPLSPLPPLCLSKRVEGLGLISVPLPH